MTSGPEIARVVDATGVVVVSGARWSMRFERRMPDRLVITIGGSLPNSAVPYLIKELEDAVAQMGRVLLFFDAWEMTGYESAIRTEMVRFFERHGPHQVPRAYILSRNRLVAMGVAVAGLAIGGGRVQGTADRAFFEATLSK